MQTYGSILPGATTLAQLAELRAQFLKQEQRYNTYRPHQALGQLTPQEWLLACAERR